MVCVANISYNCIFHSSEITGTIKRKFALFFQLIHFLYISMASWDQVVTEFSGDETTNFGPRQETGSALYQVDTIATISVDNQVSQLYHNINNVYFLT